MWDPKETIESVGLGKRERKRSTRVAEAIQMELSLFFLQKVRDQKLSGVTISRVDVTDDLRSARIFYTVSGGEKSGKHTATALVNATGFVRSHLAKVLNLRHTPSLTFIYDAKAEQVRDMETLLDAIASERNRRDGDS
ncbi:ribosome-binding factor A [Desulfocapsa sulfexigens DSM 10523]|uniref:Ribosome-binding factor A n=1 Tax=Desulfocapsa sulfexigens (strain DSM 10523 / SB164P1) TaxID=1167006 RepID=M1N9S1_DESSD|nr:30S ribosome-binding factor RbfA [Desulfocapsa sulfexigens]AGF76604.1 ribosome-binding factor A [Desulfocapsa sulfexigens DSM 10523]